jgi:hypothetical protein
MIKPLNKIKNIKANIVVLYIKLVMFVKGHKVKVG